jgi:predicted CopG family antitoxin
MSALSDEAVTLLDVIASEPNSTLMIGSHVAYSDVCRELLALRKQTALDRQSREASQAEYARLNRELNEAKDTARKISEAHGAGMFPGMGGMAGMGGMYPGMGGGMSIRVDKIVVLCYTWSTREH